jgi:hypothetical protein
MPAIAMPTVSSVVATGRVRTGAEMFIRTAGRQPDDPNRNTEL